MFMNIIKKSHKISEKYKNQKNIKTKKIKKNQKISKEKIIFYMIYQKIFF